LEIPLDFSVSRGNICDVRGELFCRGRLFPALQAGINETMNRGGKEMNQVPKQLNIELGEKESEGIYANLALITHSPSEFIIDFARVLPGTPKSKIYARIVMTPQHIKLLQNALDENVKKYENRFGKINLVGKEDEKDIGFHVKKSE